MKELQMAPQQNVQELLSFIVTSPEERMIQIAIAGYTVPHRKAAAWVQHVSQMCRRYCLANGLHPDHFTVDEILVTTSALHRFYDEHPATFGSH